MAYSVLSNKEKPVYVADSTSDLNTLTQTNPPMGTSCLVLSNGEVYIINSNRQWIPLLGSNSGGSSSSPSYSNNNFKGTESGTNITLDDVVVGTSLAGLTVYGRCSQTGTPSASSPIAIKSIANISLVISGADINNSISVPLTLIDNKGVVHLLQSVPNGKRDELIIDESGSGILYERAAKRTITSVGTMVTNGKQKSALLTFDSSIPLWDSAEAMRAETNTTDSIVGYCSKCASDKNGLYVGTTQTGFYAYAGSSATQATFDALVGATVVMRKPVETFVIPSITMPMFSEVPSTVQVAATDENNTSIDANIVISYYRDINLAINNLEEAIADIVSKS